MFFLIAYTANLLEEEQKLTNLLVMRVPYTFFNIIKDDHNYSQKAVERKLEAFDVILSHILSARFTRVKLI